MSQSTIKQARRALRRAAGDGSLQIVGELQRNVERLANSVTLAHKRIDDLETRLRALKHGDGR